MVAMDLNNILDYVEREKEEKLLRLRRGRLLARMRNIESNFESLYTCKAHLGLANVAPPSHDTYMQRASVGRVFLPNTRHSNQSHDEFEFLTL